MPTLKSCRFCEGEFKVSPSEIDIIHFCSKECRIRFYQIPCDYCGKMFIPSNRNRPTGYKTCSRKCRGAMRSKLHPKVKVRCDNCGIEIEKYTSQIREGQEVFFCSMRCIGQSEKVKRTRVESERKTKVAKNQWKPIGTIYQRKRKGRIDIFIKVAENQGYKNWMLHHRWVVEQHIGRPLEKGEEVHHLDGDETNNHIDNLAVVSKIDHSLITKLLKVIDCALAKAIVLTLLTRFPGLQEEVKVQLPRYHH